MCIYIYMYIYNIMMWLLVATCPDPKSRGTRHQRPGSPEPVRISPWETLSLQWAIFHSCRVMQSISEKIQQ